MPTIDTNQVIPIPVVIYRGGTSKAVFIKENDLPVDILKRDQLISAIFGSPDKRQIDGLGGADPLTSKLAIIGPPSREDADVDYLFGQVDILSSRIEYRGLCGNISAAVGPFAIEEGFVRISDPVTTVRIHCKNNGSILKVDVPTPNKKVTILGDYAIAGVPGQGAKIGLNWVGTIGANTGALLPTGNLQDELEIPGLGAIKASIVDVGNPGVFVNAKDLGLKGIENPEEVDSNKELLEKCDAIANAAGKKINSFCLLTLIAPAANYVSHGTEKKIDSGNIDLLVRMIFMSKMHKAYAASQINCCGIAAMIPGSIVNDVVSDSSIACGRIRMGHPAGVAQVHIEAKTNGKIPSFSKIVVYGTARRLMEGTTFVKLD